MLTLVRPLTAKESDLAVRIDRTMRAKLPAALPNPLVASWDEGQRLVLSRGEPWVVGPLEIDPYRSSTGGYPFPPEVAEKLRRISDSGARFHRIAIAHEVDPGQVAPLLPKLTGQGLPVGPADTKRMLGRTPAAAEPKALAAAMDKAIRRTLTVAKRTAAATAGALAAGVGGAMLDPIVFGVVGLDGPPKAGQPAIFYPLAAWVW